jgi:hypothetical protein
MLYSARTSVAELLLTVGQWPGSAMSADRDAWSFADIAATSASFRASQAAD